jgi:hypothetical protein
MKAASESRQTLRVSNGQGTFWEDEAMPADLVPNTAIPELAARVDADMLRVLRRIQQTGEILNRRSLDRKTFETLQRLAELGLVDPGYTGPADGPPFNWISNGNGSRVLRYLESIPQGPHYEIPSTELAAWLENQGKDRWWYVDGDPLLTGRRVLPCPASQLAEELVNINRPLLVQAKKEDTAAKGQVIGKDKLDDLVGHWADDFPVSNTQDLPLWGHDRLLYLRWKGAPDDWLLVEDSETTELMAAEEESRPGDVSSVEKE